MRSNSKLCNVLRRKVHTELHLGPSLRINWPAEARNQEFYGAVSEVAILGLSKQIYKVES